MLTKGIHQALTYLQWLSHDLDQRPTFLYEIVPLHTTLDGYHYKYGYICGGTVLTVPTISPLTLQPQPSAVQPTPNPTGLHPIVWLYLFPEDVSASLLLWGKPTGKVTNSDLDLAFSMVFHVCVVE